MKIMSLIRSEEEKNLDHLKMDLLFYKYLYSCVRFFIKRDNYYFAEIVMNKIKYLKAKDKLDSEYMIKNNSPDNRSKYLLALSNLQQKYEQS